MKFYIVLLTSLVLNLPAFSKPAPTTASTAYQDIKQTFGFVPTFLKLYPEEAIAGAWEEMKGIQFLKTSLPSKYKDLIALGVAAQIPCKSCIYFHTESAKLNGATDKEIKEAVAYAALTRHWSTWANGIQIDEATFKTEVDQMIANAKKQKPMTRITVYDADSAYQDMQATMGIVPTFTKSFPREGISGAWKNLKSLDMTPTNIPDKYKNLISVAIAGQIPCKFCSYIDTEFAKLNGASEFEIKEAVALAAIVRQWSTFVSGMQISEKTFMKEADQMLKNIRVLPKSMAKIDAH